MLNTSRAAESPLSALDRQALDWVVLLTSGSATREDADALQRWRNVSAEHERAFRDAKGLWKAIGDAVAARNAARIEGTRASSPISRRAWLGAALAASVTAALAIRPPLNLWPSAGERLAGLAADVRTQPGEMRGVQLGANVSVQLNTRTSIAKLAEDLGDFELIAGEAFVTAARAAQTATIARAASGEISFYRASLNLRRDGDRVRVSCITGECEVRIGSQAVGLSAGRQVQFEHERLGTIERFDVDVITAWRERRIVFRDQRLEEVVAELNRYRASPIVLMNDELRERRVSGTFHIDRLHEIIAQLHSIYGLQVRELPAGITLLT